MRRRPVAGDDGHVHHPVLLGAAELGAVEDERVASRPVQDLDGGDGARIADLGDLHLVSVQQLVDQLAGRRVTVRREQGKTSSPFQRRGSSTFTAASISESTEAGSIVKRSPFLAGVEVASPEPNVARLGVSG